MRAACVLLLLGAVLLPAPGASARAKGNQMMRVIAPTGQGRAAAHPFVNVIVRFGFGEATPDPNTFTARLGGVNVTPLFEPIFENGTVAGLRASLSPALLVLSPRRANRLRLSVRGRAGKRRLRDSDRVRFAAEDVADQAPIARALAAGEVILPSVPMQFDGLQSHDPEVDHLTYRWEFGDGASSDEPRPAHVFGPTGGDTTVVLTVSDGQLEAADALTLLAVPALCPGCTPGQFKMEGLPLEFGGVPLGTSATRSFTIRNADDPIAAPNSQLRVLLGTSSSAFTLGTHDLDLRAGQSATVDLAFAPTVAGHQSSEVTLVASAANQATVHLLPHGYGGAAPGPGPLPAADPLYFTDSTGSTQVLLPSGLRLGVDDSVHTCVGGTSTNNYCLTDADCAANGGTCPTVGTCFRGDRNGLPCTTSSECPGTQFGCTASQVFQPVDICGDGVGGVYLLSDEGTYDDPDQDAEIPLSSTLMHVSLDGSGNRTGAEIIARPTEGTTQLTCDAIPPGNDGSVYLAEARAVLAPGECFRDAREALVEHRKNNGATNALMARIDAAEGLPECEDYDPVTDLKVTPNGSTFFATLPNTGLWRIRPSPLLILSNFDDFFALHPDGSVVVVRAADIGSTGILKVYKIPPDQAVNGALDLNDLTPCASYEVPNNGGRTLIDATYAVDRTAPGSFDGTIVVSFVNFGAQSVLQRDTTGRGRDLIVRGAVAFASPAASDVCTPLGVVNLEFLDVASF